MLAVAPLLLFPFCDRGTVATVLLWLSLISSAWVIMSPSCRPGEKPHNARKRSLSAMLRDPLLWFSLLVVVFAGIRALNGGIALGYDAENMVWSIKEPALNILPGCVDGTGFLPFATCVALLVLLQGMRHALDAEASIAFFTTASALAGVSAIAASIALSYGNECVVDMVASSYISPQFAGTAYGIYLYFGLIALFGCAEAGWHGAELFAALGIVCSAIGFELFSPPATFAVFALVFIMLLLSSIPLMKGRLEGSASFRCAIVLLLVFSVVVLLAVFGESFGPIDSKRDALLAMKPFPDGFFAARDAMSSIALKSWRENPWLGSGLGSFPLGLRFVATPDDWTVISPIQKASTNGWWQLLVERGIIGALILAIGTGFLAHSYFMRMVKSIKGKCGLWRPACVLGPFVVVSMVALSFVDCSLLRTDVLLAVASALSLSAVAFQRRPCR